VTGDAEWQRQGVDQVRQAGELVADGHRVSGAQRQIAAAASHRQAQVRGRHRGGVVDAVADQQHPPAFRLHPADPLGLVGGQQSGVDVADPHRGRDPIRGGRPVAGEQRRSAAGQQREALDRGRGVWAQPVGQRDHAGRCPVDEHDHRGVAFALRLLDQPARAVRRLVRAEAGEQARRADLHLVCPDPGGDAPARRRGETGRGRHRQSPVAGGGHDRPPERMLTVLLGGGRPAQHPVVIRRAGECPDSDDGRRTLGEGPGLIEGDGVGAAEQLHDDGGLDQDAVPAGVGDRGQQRRHGRQHDRAGRGDDHERHRTQQRRPQRAAEGQRHGEQQYRRGDHHRRVSLLDALDEQLQAGFAGRGLLDQGDDAGDRRLVGRAAHPNPQRPAVHRAGEHLVTGLFGHRERFPGDGGLIHVAAAADDETVRADPLARPDQNCVIATDLQRRVPARGQPADQLGRGDDQDHAAGPRVPATAAWGRGSGACPGGRHAVRGPADGDRAVRRG